MISRPVEESRLLKSCKLITKTRKRGDFGAATGARTRDLFVTNEMLYRLSYCGNFGVKLWRGFIAPIYLRSYKKSV